MRQESFIVFTVVAAAVLGPASRPVFTQFQDARNRPEPVPTFEVASIKRVDPSERLIGVPQAPNAFIRPQATVASLIEYAYDITNAELVGGPTWIRKDFFEINARTADIVPPDLMRLLVRTLLAERFSLQVHAQQQDMEFVELLLASKNGRPGSGLRPCDLDARDDRPPMAWPLGGVVRIARCESIASIAHLVSGVLDVPVFDRTGLTGRWTYTLIYASPGPFPTGRLRDPADQAEVPAVGRALEEQLGLKLESRRGPVDVLVVDSVRPPTEN